MARRIKKERLVNGDGHLRRCAKVIFGAAISAAALAAVFACRTEKVAVDEPIRAYRDRMSVQHQQGVATNDGEGTERGGEREGRGHTLIQLAGSRSEETKRASLITEPEVDEVPAPTDVLEEIPDPRDAEQVLEKRLKRVIEENPRTEREKREDRDPFVVTQYRRVVEKTREYLLEFYRPRQVELSLPECIHRALEHNYVVRAEAYTPAISRTRLVEAEAAFDATFFLDFSYDNLDRATASELAGNQTDFRSYRGGIRQLLPTGMRAETSLGQSRTFTDLVFATLNPAYDTMFTASFTQPLLRGFGLDYNRAGINLARVDMQVSQETFLQQVRDTLLSVEQAYWQLVRARRTVMVLAETVGQNWATFKTMEAREYEAIPAQLNNSKSRWQSQRVQYIEAIKLVRDAEDQLKNLMNDPDFKLLDEVEIIPTEIPLVAPIALDHFAEVRAALEERSEIRQARLGIEQARIQTQRAKNETLPQLDLSFRYEVQGIGANADASFDQTTTNRFRSYAVAVSLSYPFGNRAARAALRRGRMEESKAVVHLQIWLDRVVTEVNAAVRQLMVRYKQILPQLGAVRSADDNLRALQARTEAISPTYLETELNTIEQLANTRNGLVQVITDYNVAIVQLEKAKGTLLEYNNVVVSDEPTGR